MQSFVVANCAVFNNFSTTQNITINNKIVGTITPQLNNLNRIQSYSINGRSYECYEGSIFENIEETIYIDATEYHNYDKKRLFNIYMERDARGYKKIILEISTKVGLHFLKIMKSGFPNDFDYNKINFPFARIKRISDVGGAWFTVIDPNVDSKGYFGEDIDNDADVIDAINNDTATFLSVKMDIGGTQRSLGFSKKGSILIRNRIPVNSEDTHYLTVLVGVLISLNL